MTHEEIVKEIVNKATTALFIEGIIEKDEIEQVLSIITTALTTYRTQVLEEVEKPFLNIASEYSKPRSKEDEVAVKCTQVFLKHVESLKHPTN